MHNDELRALSNELGDDDLSIFTAVRLARDDVSQGDIETALSRLRIDADKIRTLSPRLYELIALHGRREESDKTC
ncbi:hypothetical protein CRM94_17220 [Burkholderia gladioli]|uniref:Uncharacterized protein n=1 Tax=Burkholderia gladioli TaxID=28095 RepID=A0A2A7SAX9_BURGA|nr:hypothetical protein [Burkholderia gladioli]PEH40455.1 hypothetical protein CRM94_17220 [Burkholderia gladioli]